MKKKVFVVGNAWNYMNFIEDAERADNIKSADIVIFTGGEDVDPSLYGAKKHPRTYSNIERDIYEQKIFKSIPKGKLVIGICRGSQFLCVMNGGKLIQHVSDHALYGTHPITNRKDGLVLEITSTHHQMQYPYELDENKYDVIFSAAGISVNYEGDKLPLTIEHDMNAYGEPEIVLYHVKGNPKCLAIQGHPEMMRMESPVVKWLNSYINELIH